MTDFHEHLIEPGEDPVNDALYEIAKSMPFIFLAVSEFTEDGGFNLDMQVGGGVSDLQTIWAFLSKAQQAIELQMLDRGEVPAYMTDEEFDALDDSIDDE